MQNQVMLIGVFALIAIGVVVWFATRQRRTQQLKDRFGPEYDRTVRETDNRGRAESELQQREQRVEQLHIRPLEASERDAFAERWRSAQEQFVDDPGGAIKEADRLVSAAMQARGYPVSDFEQRAADISVDHPLVVANHRAAHEIALRNERGEADTEALRKAMVHYRALFEDLLETTTTERAEVRP
jgi:FtsZ-interacting cell division protein ZipA